MKGLFIPEITAEMFRNGCLEGIEALMADGEIYDIEYSPWIPVSERLPDEKLFNPTGSDFGFDFEEVLCTTIWGVVRAYKFGTPIGHYRPHFWLGDGIMDEYVIAWKPLPEPYKKEGESDADS